MQKIQLIKWLISWELLLVKDNNELIISKIAIFAISRLNHDTEL